MKALKVWNWILYVTAISLYFYGLFSGEFTGFLTGTSDKAIMLTIFYAVCFILAITVTFVVYAIEDKK